MARQEHDGECYALQVLYGSVDLDLRHRLRGKEKKEAKTTATRLAVRLLNVRARHFRNEKPLDLLDPTADDPESPDVCHDCWLDVEELEPYNESAMEELIESLPATKAREVEGGANGAISLAPKFSRCSQMQSLKLALNIRQNAMALAPEKYVRKATNSQKQLGWDDHGLGLYPSAAMLNHSCAPNCLWFVDTGGVLVVETTQIVKKGQELTIPYLPVSRSIDTAASDRRSRLKDVFGFTCMCQRCTAEDTVCANIEMNSKTMKDPHISVFKPKTNVKKRMKRPRSAQNATTRSPKMAKVLRRPSSSA
eukprot:gnl/MRDRNA2_/MRDRNA2_241624_c0_seq1.p1 gnl/MRDRNA2_/MRDRNA2_241624_c0~~gnl/MRDRNA2_/MRDRNA2_241624_c0_seq1.p1  ORF type:complete len:356 (+),score=55.88 gnl/MRDRNA2_/MRDRNA2_241624_c0_seq1:147-1070(+)